jgi:hypothetical protein
MSAYSDPMYSQYQAWLQQQQQQQQAGSDPNNPNPTLATSLQQPTAASGGIPTYSANQATNPYVAPQSSSGDPNVMLRDQIARTATQTGNLQNTLTGAYNTMSGQEAAYGNQVPQLYSDIWAGGGGYSADQQAQVQQTPAMSGLAAQSSDPNALNAGELKDYESQSMYGDPYAAYNAFTSQDMSGNARAVNTSYTDQTRNKFYEGRDAMTGTVNQLGTDYTGVNQNLQQGLQNAINPTALAAGVNPTALSMSPGYTASQNNALAAGTTGVQSAYSDPSLELSSDYLNTAPMTDSEVQSMASQAASDAGAGYRANLDTLNRQAAAGGTTNPLALAEERRQLEMTGGADVNDAITRARLAARQVQMGQAQNVEATRLGATQYQTGLQTSGSEALMNAGLNTAQQNETTRLGAAQNLANLQTNVAQDLSNRQMTAATDTGQMAYNTATNQANTGLGAQSNIMNTGIGMEENLGSQATNLQQAYDTMGLGTLQTAEQQAAARQATIANTNVAGREYASTQGYQRPLTTATTTSGLAQSAYAPQQAAQVEGRTAAQNEQQYYGGQMANLLGQSVTNQTAGNALTNQALGTYTQNKQAQAATPSTAERIVGGVLNAAAGVGSAIGGGIAQGGVISRPTQMIVGEHGPEVIMPAQRAMSLMRNRIASPSTSRYRMNMNQPSPYSEMGRTI